MAAQITNFEERFRLFRVQKRYLSKLIRSDCNILLIFQDASSFSPLRRFERFPKLYKKVIVCMIIVFEIYLLFGFRIVLPGSNKSLRLTDIGAERTSNI